MSSVNPKLIVLPRARKDFDRPKAQVFEVVVQKRATARRGPPGSGSALSVQGCLFLLLFLSEGATFLCFSSKLVAEPAGSRSVFVS